MTALKEKYYIVLNEYERKIIINSLNELRNRLIANGRYTDAVMGAASCKVS